MSRLNFFLGLIFLLGVGVLYYFGMHPELRPRIGIDVPPDATIEAEGPQAGGPQTSAPLAIGHPDNEGLTTNQAGVEIIKSHEALALEAYPERDYFLIGYGHKGAEVHEGMVITPKEAERLLKQDLKRLEAAVLRAVTVPLNENEFSACVLLAYNIGSGAFRNSTVLKRLNQDDRQAAADAFLMWNKISKDGEPLESPALTSRREEERALFLSPVD